MTFVATHDRVVVSDWRDYFAGAWRMARRIDDRRGGRCGDAAGEAVFTAVDDTAATLVCRETLDIAYGGQRWPGYQETLWRFEEGAGPHLYFSDGRFFCDMAFARNGDLWRAVFTHKCGDDLYEGEASIFDRDSWRLIWCVTGPRKDYTLDTEYFRIGGDC